MTFSILFSRVGSRFAHNIVEGPYEQCRYKVGGFSLMQIAYAGGVYIAARNAELMRGYQAFLSGRNNLIEGGNAVVVEISAGKRIAAAISLRRKAYRQPRQVVAENLLNLVVALFTQVIV